MKDKKELKEIRFDSTEIILRDNLVRGAILPQKISELNRIIVLEDNVVVEGAIYGKRIEIRGDGVEVLGAVYAQNEVYVSSDAKGTVIFRKTVGSSDSVVSRATQCNPLFCCDINAKTVALRNAYVAGSIYADEITLENCVVIGGVFATQEATFNNCIIGTFNSPRVSLDGTIQLLLPSAFTIEPPVIGPNTRLYNLALADLGALFKGLEQDPMSGRIPMNLEADEVKSTLTNEDVQRTLRSFTVIGKVLAADMVDIDRFQNHFLLTAAALGPQLLKTYDLGDMKDGKKATLDEMSLRNFFFDLLTGKKDVRELESKFSLLDLK